MEHGETIGNVCSFVHAKYDPNPCPERVSCIQFAFIRNEQTSKICKMFNLSFVRRRPFRGTIDMVPEVNKGTPQCVKRVLNIHQSVTKEGWSW